MLVGVKFFIKSSQPDMENTQKKIKKQRISQPKTDGSSLPFRYFVKYMSIVTTVYRVRDYSNLIEL